MKRITALLLSVMMIFCMLSGCADSHFRFKNDTSVTRGEWIEQLAATFGMQEYIEEEPYVSDVLSDDPIFASVQSCYEWGILRDISKKLKKNNGASLEFAVTTAVYATGADLSTYEGKSDSEKALRYAVENDIVSDGMDYSKWITDEQCADILSASQMAYMNMEITPIDKVVFNESVSDERETDNIQHLSENDYVFTNIQPSVGDVYIAPGTKENPDGVAIKITDVVENENGTVTVSTTKPEIYEVFDEIEYGGVVIPEIEDIIPSEGVTISELNSNYLSDDESSSMISKESGTIEVTTMAKSKKSRGVSTLEQRKTSNSGFKKIGIGTSKKEALSFTASCNFTKGKVSISPKWNNASIEIEQLLTGKNGGTASPELGQWFKKKAVFPDKTLFGPDAYSNDEAIEAYKKGVISANELKEALEGMQNEDGTEKIRNIENEFSGGYEITGSLSITDLYVVPTYKLKTAKVLGMETSVPIGISSFSVETNYGAEVSLSIKGRIENDLTICSIPVALGGIGTLTIDIVIHMGLNGEISVKAEISNYAKTEYASGKTKKTSKQEAEASYDAEVEGEIGPKVNCKLSICGIDPSILNASVSVELHAKAHTGAKLSTEWSETEEMFVIDRKTVLTHGLELHCPIVKMGVGTDKNSLANKLNICFKWTISGEEGSNAPFTARKTSIVPEEERVLWQEHLELPKNPEEIENVIETDGQEESKLYDSLGSNMDISSYYVHLDIGEEVMFDIDYPDGYSSEDFVWSTSDSSIVSVKNGRLKAKKSGSVIITATSNDGKYYANCAVYVGSVGSGGGGGSSW